MSYDIRGTNDSLYRDTTSYGVRPLVSLQSDIQLDKNPTNENTYDIK